MKLPKQGENRGGKKEGKPKKGIGQKHGTGEVTDGGDVSAEKTQDEG